MIRRMRGWLRKLVGDERGVAAVVVVGAMLALMGFAAISIDAGRAYVEKQHLQDTADAAALAATTYLDTADEANAVRAEAVRVAGLNGITDADNRVHAEVVPADGATPKHVRVTVDGSVDFLFGRVLGVPTTSLTAAAKATGSGNTPPGVIGPPPQYTVNPDEQSQGQSDESQGGEGPDVTEPGGQDESDTDADPNCPPGSPPPSNPPNYDVEFVIDVTGSMSWSDPGKKRVDATQTALSSLISGDRAGIVRFSTQVSEAYAQEVRALGTVRSLDSAERQQLSYRGGATDIYAGASLGLQELRDARESGRDQFLVLLTDGKHNSCASGGCDFDALIADAGDASEGKVTIYTVGLGEGQNLNESLLRRMAEETGGAYYHVQSSEGLVQAFRRVMESAGRGGTCGAGDSQERNSPSDLDTRHVVPIAVSHEIFEGGDAVDFNDRVRIRVKGNVDKDDWNDRRWWGGRWHVQGLSLRLGGREARAYEQNLQYGYWGSLTVQDVVERKPGAMRGPFRRAVQWRIDQDPGATYDSVLHGSTRVVYLPVAEVAETGDGHGHGHDDDQVGKVRVLGFAAFFIESYGWDHGYNELYGRFIRWVPGPEAQPAPPGRTASNYGMTANAPRLIP